MTGPSGQLNYLLSCRPLDFYNYCIISNYGLYFWQLRQRQPTKEKSPSHVRDMLHACFFSKDFSIRSEIKFRSLRMHTYLLGKCNNDNLISRGRKRTTVRHVATTFAKSESGNGPVWRGGAKRLHPPPLPYGGSSITPGRTFSRSWGRIFPRGR